jgi:all-trans-8'-apo-beta-carotenal 15,15'-oxygenase
MQTQSAPDIDLKHAWARAYESQHQELAYWIDDVEGTIPADLHGTLFRNGPGLLDINGQSYHHPIDGDGMVCSVAFAKGRAFFRNRFVRTIGFLEEQAAGRILYRSPFGTQKPGGVLANMFDLRLKNLANTSALYWGGKLLALWEGGEPHRLDPSTLETLGLDTMDNMLSPGNEFAAHPRLDPDPPGSSVPHLINFGAHLELTVGPSQTTLTLYELTPDGTLVHRHAYRVKGFTFFHDMLITPNYCIFFQLPMTYNPLPYLFGFSSIVQSMELDPNRPTTILLLPRTPGGEVQTFKTTSGFIFHHVNAFEQGDEVWIDTISYDDFPQVGPNDDFRKLSFELFPPGQIWRYKVNLKSKQVHRQRIQKRSCEFPRLNPAVSGRTYRYTYLTAAPSAEVNGPHQCILKMDMQNGTEQLWNDTPYGFPGEPVFVPRKGGTQEDDGWVLSLVYDAAHHRSDVVILDARDIAKGPLARLHLKQHIPHGFHGNFADEYFGPQQEAG